MTTGVVRARILDGIAVVRMDQPPANTLGGAMREAVSGAITQFAANPSIDAIVLGAEGNVFSAGTDLRDYESEAATASLGALCQQIETCPKPVIAALQGAAIGSGAEIALAAHWRVANRKATIGLPGIALGLPPNAGGTQRLTRWIGPKVAIQMMQGGRPVDEMAGQRIGLFDKMVHDDVLASAATFARSLTGPEACRPAGQQRGHLNDGIAFMNAVRLARQRSGGSFAKRRIVDCVEAALLLPYAAALDFESGAFDECLAHADSRALRHLFLAERQISEALLLGVPGQPRKLTTKGQAVVARLFAAQDRAIVTLISAGATEAEVDGAMVAYGFVAGPFGGRDGQDGARSLTVQRRVIAALMAEGARCLEQGLVARASDIDVLAAQAMGFPRHRGGPMQAAHMAGLLGLSRKMAGWALEDQVWAAPDVVARAALESDGFAALDRS
jgi:3-hydroxyacyl-CoA dehydrogenase